MREHCRATVVAAPPALGGAGQLATLQREVVATVAESPRNRADSGPQTMFGKP
ncbi:hypothetical protein D3C77_783200 [compost metagenome]